MQDLMRISGILPTQKGTFAGKFLDVLKQFVLLLGPIYVTTACFAFGIVHSRELRLLTSSMYISTACAIGICLSLSHFYQSNDIQRLLSKMERLVNESLCLI